MLPSEMGLLLRRAAVGLVRTRLGIGSLVFAILVPALLFLYSRFTSQGVGATTEQQVRATLIAMALLLVAAFAIQLVRTSRQVPR